MNIKIRSSLANALSKAKRPVDSRKLAKKIAQQHHTSIFRIWGNISYMKNAGALVFIVQKKGGPSYVKA